jgi:hypothetical protein
MRRAVIVTWNPGRNNAGDWSPREWDRMVAKNQGAAIETDRWCVGRHRNNIEPGDGCYLLRQGTFGRGIVAVGQVASYPTANAYRGEAGRPTNYVEIEWRASLPIDDRITTEELGQRVPGIRWSHLYQSGHVVMSETTVQALAAVWTDRHDAVWASKRVCASAGNKR